MINKDTLSGHLIINFSGWIFTGFRLKIVFLFSCLLIVTLLENITRLMLLLSEFYLNYFLGHTKSTQFDCPVRTLGQLGGDSLSNLCSTPPWSLQEHPFPQNTPEGEHNASLPLCRHNLILYPKYHRN